MSLDPVLRITVRRVWTEGDIWQPVVVRVMVLETRDRDVAPRIEEASAHRVIRRHRPEPLHGWIGRERGSVRIAAGARRDSLRPYPVPGSTPSPGSGLRPDVGRLSEAATAVQPHQRKPAGQNR
jgi:hypothetical protein